MEGWLERSPTPFRERECLRRVWKLPRGVPAVAWGLLGLLPVVTGVPLWAWTPPAIERGFKPERAFQVSDYDAVQLLNGSLRVQIPVGGTYPVGNAGLSYQLALFWSGNLWRYGQLPYGPFERRTVAEPVEEFNAGFGFRLSLGELYTGSGPACDRCYIAPDGSQHVFSATLHPGLPPHPDVDYTTDGSYLRLRRDGVLNEWVVDFPNGVTHRFDSDGQFREARDS